MVTIQKKCETYGFYLVPSCLTIELLLFLQLSLHSLH